MLERNMRKAHIELWQWLHDNPELDKHQWPGWRGNGGRRRRAHGLCYACELESQRAVKFGAVGEGNCEFCPLDASVSQARYGEHTTCGIFWRWNESKDEAERRELAAQIRDAWR